MSLDASPSRLVGELIARRYRVSRALGSGSLATAFAAFDLVHQRDVALKVLTHPTAERLAILRREFSTLAGRVHPHLARAHDFASARTSDGRVIHFFSSEWVDGVPIDEFAREQTWAAVSPVLEKLLSALDFLHRAGLRHGDVKPTNVLVTTGGEPKLIDFSCAGPFSEHGQVSGTPRYLAPEVLRGGSLDARTDLFALGVLLAELFPLLSEPPPRAVAELAERLRRSDASERPLDVASVLDELGVTRPEGLTRSPEPPGLLEREVEMHAFEALLRRLRERRPGPRCLWLRGESGAGKTRLFCEMKWRAELEVQVVDTDALGDTPIRGLIERASGEPVSDELAALLACEARLAQADPPTLLVLDDAQFLAEARWAELAALIRSLDPAGSLAVLVASDPSLDPPPDCLVHRLAPLTKAALGLWCGSLVPETRLEPMLRATGGRPGVVAQVLAELASGRLSEAELDRVRPNAVIDAAQGLAIGRAEPAARRALSLFAVHERPLSDAELGPLGIPPRMLGELGELGWVRAQGGGHALAHGVGASALCELLGEQLVAEAHAALAQWFAARLQGELPDLERSELSAARIRHLLATGAAEQAARELASARALAPLAPRAWLSVAEAMLETSKAPEARLDVAELLESSGRPQRAIELLTVAEPWSGVLEARRQQRLGSAWLGSGDAARAATHFEAAHAPASEPVLAAEIGEARARAALQLGNYALAESIALAALHEELPEPLRVALLSDVGAAASYLGDMAKARDSFQRAEAVAAGPLEPRAAFRLHSHRAFHEFRAGHVGLAIEHYTRALSIAETSGLDDRIADSAVSLAAAHHQAGAWAEALASYERGLLAAVALGQTASEVRLRFNLAKLHADIGLFDRASAEAERARAGAARAGLPLLGAASVAVLGAVELARGRTLPAREHFAHAEQAFAREGALREEVEVALERAEAELLAGELDAAARALSALEPKLASLEAPDVGIRFELVSGRVALARNDLARAQRSLERAARDAEGTDQAMLAAEAELALARLWTESGAAELAERARRNAVCHFERVSAGLPPKLREAFFRHPARQELTRPRADGGAPARASGGASAIDRYRRLLEINKRLSSSLDPNEVLERTMDAAIELTFAERGFLIQRSPKKELTVSVARNLDREQIGKKHLKFSRSIAERTLESGEPVVTVDAGADERFSDNASVHAMRLKSVVCVPIRSPGGVVGALYLDNRFRRDSFQPGDIELLMAFADQVAIALENARLHAELRAQSAELERERKRVEELSRSQALEIGRLTTRVRAQQEVLEHRYDYAEIVGRGPKMQAVFATLDRVTDTAVNVLVEGESGTGKELVARAIHFNGSRRDRPYVAINCGAVPANLLESELFGHVRGAFTGADREREGLFVSVAGGTVFLDEIGEMPPEMQVKLLRVLQEREVRPIGSQKTLRVDFRLVSATNRRLREEVDKGRFREDLYYRVGVVEVRLPALRERIEDLPALVQHFLSRLSKEHQLKAPRLSPRALSRLASYAWPGNVRELENVLTRTLVLSRGERIEAEDVALPEASLAAMPESASREGFTSAEADQIRAALAANRWNVSATCRALGLPRSSFYRKLARYGIEVG